MSQPIDMSQDTLLGTETFELRDPSIDESSWIDPRFLEGLEQDPAPNPTLLVDHLELQELGVEFDDPEMIVTLDGGIDDPDGIGEPPSGAHGEVDAGWDLDVPLVPGGAPDS